MSNDLFSRRRKISFLGVCHGVLLRGPSAETISMLTDVFKNNSEPGRFCAEDAHPTTAMDPSIIISIQHLNLLLSSLHTGDIHNIP
jgi:hypothetical protein